MMIAMKMRPCLTILLLAAACLSFSCSKKEREVTLGELTGYATHPFASIKAFDVSGSQGRWVEGVVDDEARTVDFRFHSLTNFSDVLIKAVMEENWASMVWPDTLVFRADLSKVYKITVNDGVDNVNYSLAGREYPLMEDITLTLSTGETVSCTWDGQKASAKAATSYGWSALQGVHVGITLSGDASLVSPSSASLASVDFSTGNTLSIVCQDNVTGRQRTYVVSAMPADVATLTSDWADVTHTAPWNTAVLSDCARIYKTGSLYGYAGNVGYLYTLPAGKVQMKVLDKWKHMGGNTSSNISAVVRAHRDWSLFIPAQGPQRWKLASDKAATYYSPLAYGADGSGVVGALRAEGFGGSRSNGMYAPAIAMKDGKASIRSAATKEDGNLYSYTGVAGYGEALWNVDCAFGGMFQILKDGEPLVGSDSDEGYDEYNASHRHFTTLYQNLDYTWGYKPVGDWDRLRTGRVLIGCTAEGGLVVLAVEKFVNTHNQGQGSDAGLDGVGDTDRRGLNFFEAGKLMASLGCSDAMVVEDLNWTFCILQDGTDRGLDWFKTNSRYDFQTEGSPRKDETSELTNLAILCIK